MERFIKKWISGLFLMIISGMVGPAALAVTTINLGNGGTITLDPAQITDRVTVSCNDQASQPVNALPPCKVESVNDGEEYNIYINGTNVYHTGLHWYRADAYHELESGLTSLKSGKRCWETYTLAVSEKP